MRSNSMFYAMYVQCSVANLMDLFGTCPLFFTQIRRICLEPRTRTAISISMTVKNTVAELCMCILQKTYTYLILIYRTKRLWWSSQYLFQHIALDARHECCISLKSFHSIAFNWINQTFWPIFPLTSNIEYTLQPFKWLIIMHVISSFVYRSVSVQILLMLFCIRQAVTALLAVLFICSMLQCFFLLCSDYLGNWYKAISIFFGGRWSCIRNDYS